LIAKGRSAKNVRNIIRNIVKEAPGSLNEVAKQQVIDKYLKLINELDTFPVEVVGKRMWGDTGKVIHMGGGNYNAGFIKGQFEQLEVLDELVKAGKNKNKFSLEKGDAIDMGDGTTVLRYTDIKYEYATGKFSFFETKNFTHYSGDNISNAVKGMEKEVARALQIAKDQGGSLAEHKGALDQIYFIFRGNPQGAEKMLEKMKSKGMEVLSAAKLSKEDKASLLSFWKSKFPDSPMIKTTPAVCDLVIFQGKKVPYGD
jgi:hypothetical protein